MDFGILLGKTLESITGAHVDSESIYLVCSDGTEYTMYHDQSCCEHVRVEDINGDVSDLLHSPITQAEEVSNYETDQVPEYAESYTWTFYKLATIKGYVTIRWLGESNGYYSESVDFEQIK